MTLGAFISILFNLLALRRWIKRRREPALSKIGQIRKALWLLETRISDEEKVFEDPEFSAELAEFMGKCFYAEALHLSTFDWFFDYVFYTASGFDEKRWLDAIYRKVYRRENGEVKPSLIAFRAGLMPSLEGHYYDQRIIEEANKARRKAQHGAALALSHQARFAQPVVNKKGN